MLRHNRRKLSVSVIKSKIEDLLKCLADPILTPRDRVILKLELARIEKSLLNKRRDH